MRQAPTPGSGEQAKVPLLWQSRAEGGCRGSAPPRRPPAPSATRSLPHACRAVDTKARGALANPRSGPSLRRPP